MNSTKRTVLIVDDSPEDREQYRRYLLRATDCSYTLIEAGSGEEGLTQWHQCQPDAVLLDYSLPDLDGLEFLAAVQSQNQQPFLPVIVVTGQGNEAIAVQSMKAGAQDYLVKGQITSDLLLRSVKEVIEKVQLRTELQQRIERERLMEVALRESEARFRQLSASIDVVFWITELPSLQFLYVSPAYERLWGLKCQDLYDRREAWVDLIHPDDRKWVEKAFLEKAPIGQFDAEYRIVLPDGRIRWVHDRGFPLRQETDRIDRLAGIVEDISERKRAEGERKQAELEREHWLLRELQYANKLHGLTQAALAINSTATIDTVLNVITEQAHQIIGCHQAVTSMTIRQDWSQAVTAIYLSDKYAKWRNYNEKPDGSGIYSLVCQLNRPIRMTQSELENHPRWTAYGKEAAKHPPLRGWLAVPLVGRDGSNIGLIQLSDKYEGEFTEEDETVLIQLAQLAAIAIENTRLYQAEQQARAIAEQANRIKDDFLAILSHELRSPLNPILGWTKLLQTRTFDAARTAEALATIERNAKLQTQLIDDLLDISKILRGKLTLNVVAVDLTAVIEAAIDTVRTAAVAKSISLHAVLPSIGTVSGDVTRLQQVVWNLLSNAVKFTALGGRVDIWLEQVEGQAQITVSDTGKGINPDFLPHIFELFRQEDVSTTRQYGGLGLGLAIVRQLVEAHGGTITVDSPGEGQGATFTVRLPLLARTQSIEPIPKLGQVTDLTGIVILTVDDEPDTRELFQVALSQYGAEVITATSADEVLTVLKSHQPHILLSDISMPDVDGYTLLQQVRALPPEQGGQIPAIALTAYAREEDQQRVLQSGFQHHLTKPVEPEQLVQIVFALAHRNHLSKR